MAVQPTTSTTVAGTDLARRPVGTLWRARDRDSRAREELVRRYMSFARRIGLRFRSPREPTDDVLQVAYVGLVKAVDRFEYDRQIPFEAFASPTIKGELLRHIRDDAMPVRVPRSLQAMARRAEGKRDELAAELGRAPKFEEIASALGEDPETVQLALRVRKTRAPLRLLDPEGDEESEGRQIWPGSEDPGFSRAEDRIILGSAAGLLSREERQILTLRFYEDLTQTEIAKRLGVSQMKVSRSLSRSLARLLRALEATH